MRILIYFPLFYLFFLNVAQAQLYVSNTGVNTGNCQNINNPCSLPHALSVAGPQSVIQMIPGIYTFNNTVNITIPVKIMRYGFSGDVIIDGSNWSLAFPGDQSLFTINNTDNVTIENLFFQNRIDTGANAILIEGACNNILIDSCSIRNIGWRSNDLVTKPIDGALDNAHAILVKGTAQQPIKNLTIRNTKVINCAPGFSEAITLVGNVDSSLLENNVLDSIQNIGIGIAGGYDWVNTDRSVNRARNIIVRRNKVSRVMSAISPGAGIYIDGSNNCIIERNEVFKCGVGISLGAERIILPGGLKVNHNIIRSNLIHHNVTAGMVLGANFDSNHTNFVTNSVVANNILFHNRTGEAINGIFSIGGFSLGDLSSIYTGEIALQNSDTTLLINNVIFPTDDRQMIVAGPMQIIRHFSSDYNLYYSNGSQYPFRSTISALPLNITYPLVFNDSIFSGSGIMSFQGWKDSTALDANSLNLSPQFLDTTTFTPVAASPLINNGAPNYGVAYCGISDYPGNNRYYNHIDIGAVELQANPTSVFDVNSIAHDKVILYPNPANTTLTLLINDNSLLNTTAILLDSKGSVVFVQKIHTVHQFINIKNLTQGLYLIRFANGEVHRLIRE
ncbi:MAG TPA: T9SS type A sorting domain-containing protein [Flavipsychrobacter sp.]|nr:T9SS type A sorting domain-containing protein [Flavipsychrobacter sp.]